MLFRLACFAPLVALCFLVWQPTQRTNACCPAPQNGRAVVNADQTVIMIWNPETKTQHFIRKASFASDGEDFGFIVPSPTQPELAESGGAAFGRLAAITAPKVIVRSNRQPNMGCGCSAEPTLKATANRAEAVQVLAQQRVAGFDATVLKADNADSLTEWLQEHEFAYSQAVADWAQPYIEQGWVFTALKIAPPETDAEGNKVAVTADTLRLTFTTDRPLFPYREPDFTAEAEQLNAKERLLRIYFLADQRYSGELTPQQAWTGKPVWSDKLSTEQRAAVLQDLALADDAGPAEFWLTEFEDYWPYEVAPADVYFAAAAKQDVLHRPDVIHYASTSGGIDVTALAIAFVLLIPPLWLRALQGGKRA
jgi:hypothetical protein